MDLNLEIYRTSRGQPPATRHGLLPNNVVDQGQYAARSGVITNSQTSSLILSTNFTAGTGSFDYKVSSEQGWDSLNFYVDGVLLQQWSGEIGWANYAFPADCRSAYAGVELRQRPQHQFEGLDAALLTM